MEGREDEEEGATKAEEKLEEEEGIGRKEENEEVVTTRL